MLHYAFTFAQNTDVINWIDKHAVTIEYADPDTPLIDFAESIPDKLKMLEYWLWRSIASWKIVIAFDSKGTMPVLNLL